MKIISHRGFWLNEFEKNSAKSFERSFQEGFGTETDVRDLAGRLVISHDMPIGGELELSHFLFLASSYQLAEQPALALNIKSDGLAIALGAELVNYPELDVFVFDMSVPDMRSYFNAGFKVFTRMSEVEMDAVWIEKSSGVWLDSFASDWFSSDLIVELLNLGKRVCLVSPELHGRDHLDLWDKILSLRGNDRLILCTDYPIQAKSFFGL
jgi:glycerophosphoryl diester phosphodiesterase